MKALQEIKYKFLIIFILLSLTGCCHLNKTLGLKAIEGSSSGKDFLVLWIPFGFRESDYMGMDLLYFRRQISCTKDLKTNIICALNELLKGPKADEVKKGALALVYGNIIDLKINNKKAIVRFSRDFNPAGGTLAVTLARIAVEEVVRQFPEINDLDIKVEGIPDEEVLQP